MKDQTKSPGITESERGIARENGFSFQRVYGWNEPFQKNRMCVGFNGRLSNKDVYSTSVLHPWYQE